MYSWREIKYSLAHLNSYNYKREYDSHLMKSTEWGAVAYLQHSIYGSRSNVRINNNSAYITGYAAINEPLEGFVQYKNHESTNLGMDGTKTYNYKNSNSQVASTTGNITGIYDMVGSAIEYVMGVMLNSNNTAPLSGRNSTYNAGFNGLYGEGGALTSGIIFPEERYYDSYLYATTNTTYNRRILGDATSEFGPFSEITYGSNKRQMGSWYNDDGWFALSKGPYFSRGGDIEYGISAGIFQFYGAAGNGTVYYGFRIVLAI